MPSSGAYPNYTSDQPRWLQKQGLEWTSEKLQSQDIDLKTKKLTDKPAIVALFHHVHDVTLFQLQLVLVAWKVVVDGLVPVLGNTNGEQPAAGAGVTVVSKKR